jgi:hypothetical protein
MSLANRQKTCPACGNELKEDDRVNVEPLVDDAIRYICVHTGCSTFVHHPKEEPDGGSV